MTILYPEIDSPELKPYAAPLGRLMLAYGRAVAATISLAEYKLGSEIKAAQLVNKDSDKLPKRMRKLFRGDLKGDNFKAFSHALTRMKIIAAERHQLVHGQWWLKFVGGHLQTRNVQNGRIKHTKPFSPHLLEQYASELDSIATQFDDLEMSLPRLSGGELLARLGRMRD